MIAQSLDKVEREFEIRDQQIRVLEAKLVKAEGDLATANDVIASQKSDIAKAVALQRTLLMQYQESEIESKELHEFLQAAIHFWLKVIACFSALRISFK